MAADPRVQGRRHAANRGIAAAWKTGVRAARGKLVACGTPSEITQTCSDVRVQIEQQERDEVLAHQVEGLGGTIEPSGTGGACLRVPAAAVYKVMGLLETRRARLVAVSPQRETLEDAFLRLVGG